MTENDKSAKVGLVTEDASRSLAQFSLPTNSPATIGFGRGQTVILLSCRFCGLKVFIG